MKLGQQIKTTLPARLFPREGEKEKGQKRNYNPYFPRLLMGR